MIAGWFMLAGIMFLVWLGRDQSRIIDVPMGPMDLQPLIAATAPLEPKAWEEQIVILHFWELGVPHAAKSIPNSRNSMSDLRVTNDSCS